MKTLIIFVCCLYASVAWSACPIGDAYFKKGFVRQAWISYKDCGERLNDSESLFYVANGYLNGNETVNQSLRNAYLYFRMAAENGYAPAQRELAKLIDALNELGAQGKTAVAEFNAEWNEKNKTNEAPLSALAWATLAAEKKENKWFYIAAADSDKEALNLIPKLKRNNDVKEAEKQAVAFKQRQLMRQARALLSDKAYQDFEALIYPDKFKGKVKKNMSRTAAIEELKKIKQSKEK